MPLVSSAEAGRVVQMAIDRMTSEFFVDHAGAESVRILWRSKLGETTQDDVNRVTAAFRAFKLSPPPWR